MSMQGLRSAGPDRFDDARAVRLIDVPHGLPVFETHFPRLPVLPGVLILSGLSHLAGRLLTRRRGGVWDLAGFRGVRFRRTVGPGERMELVVVALPADDQTASGDAVVSGSVRVNGVLAVSVRQILLRPAFVP